MGQHPSAKPAFPWVKAQVSHPAPAGALSKNPFFLLQILLAKLVRLLVWMVLRQCTQCHLFWKKITLNQYYVISGPVIVSQSAPEDLPSEQQATEEISE